MIVFGKCHQQWTVIHSDCLLCCLHDKIFGLRFYLLCLRGLFMFFDWISSVFFSGFGLFREIWFSICISRTGTVAIWMRFSLNGWSWMTESSKQMLTMTMCLRISLSSIYPSSFNNHQPDRSLQIPVQHLIPRTIPSIQPFRQKKLPKAIHNSIKSSPNVQNQRRISLASFQRENSEKKTRNWMNLSQISCSALFMNGQ